MKGERKKKVLTQEHVSKCVEFVEWSHFERAESGKTSKRTVGLDRIRFNVHILSPVSMNARMCMSRKLECG